MELVVISHGTKVKNEVNLVKSLFDNGLTKYHYRKPLASLQQCKGFLSAFNKADLAKIALHQYHHLVKDFDIKHLHFKEYDRCKTDVLELESLKSNGFTLSTSVHDVNDLNTLVHFDYAFLGPVFNSISKVAYQAKMSEIWLKAIKNSDIPIYAIGGVDKTNIQQLKAFGFKGAAVLGAIWKATHPIEEFKALKP
jgi:thiamine-phosphate pyrophosphorylase